MSNQIYQKNILYSVALLVFCLSCQNETITTENTNIHFKNISPKHSNIHFSNNIIENDTLNYFTFPYLYMGGGVAIGDINNDGLSDIFVTGNMVSNRLYLNQGNFQFQDISGQAGVSGDQRWYTGVTMADVNNDGWLDIYVCVSGQHSPFENQLYINQKDNTFKEQAKQYGIADASTSIQSSFFDYDLDGDLDLLVANYPQILVSQGNEFYYQKMKANLLEESAHLYRNNGDDTFTDVTQQAGIQNFGLTLGIATADFNEDSYPDIYLSNDFNVPDYFYLNNGDGTFRESIQKSTRHTSMFGMGVDAADFNNDGLLDFAQVDMTPEDYKRAKTNMASMSPASFQQAVDIGFHYQYMQNSVQLHQGMDEQGTPIFSDLARMTGMATTDWSWGVQFMDLDNDGWQDVFISNGMKRDVNNNDVNADYEFSSTFGDPTQRDITTLPSEPISNYAFRNEGNLSFSKVTKDWGLAQEGFTNGFAYADLDNDGDLDLVLNNLDATLGVFENESTANNYLQIQFKGSGQNPFGIGTKVRLQVNGQQQYQELQLTRGFQSSVAPVLHFGLVEAIQIEQIEVIWSDGKTQILENITANQRLTLNYQEAQTHSGLAEKKTAKFKEITTISGINFKHTEDEYNDYKKEILLPHKNSQFGPALAVGDVNGDGWEDFFVGNATDAAAKLYIQQADGTFRTEIEPWSADVQYEDTGAHFFDADQDGDLDLYVVNGGNDPNRSDDYCQDRLYINTPDGFKNLEAALPKMPISGQVVASNDFDGD
ncbi:MAG: VCBS repeat-containing protein, partial [Bacteroidota bacterium]